MNALLAAIAAAGVVAGISAYAAYDALIDDPLVVAAERAKCAAEVEAAAGRAIAAEQARQFRISERAWQQGWLQEQEERAWQEARVSLLEQEIDDHERQRAAAGKSCPLDDRDLDFLAGRVHRQPAH